MYNSHYRGTTSDPYPRSGQPQGSQIAREFTYEPAFKVGTMNMVYRPTEKAIDGRIVSLVSFNHLPSFKCKKAQLRRRIEDYELIFKKNVPRDIENRLRDAVRYSNFNEKTIPDAGYSFPNLSKGDRLDRRMRGRQDTQTLIHKVGERGSGGGWSSTGRPIINTVFNHPTSQGQSNYFPPRQNLASGGILNSGSTQAGGVGQGNYRSGSGSYFRSNSHTEGSSGLGSGSGTNPQAHGGYWRNPNQPHGGSVGSSFFPKPSGTQLCTIGQNNHQDRTQNNSFFPPKSNFICPPPNSGASNPSSFFNPPSQLAPISFFPGPQTQQSQPTSFFAPTPNNQTLSYLPQNDQPQLSSSPPIVLLVPVTVSGLFSSSQGSTDLLNQTQDLPNFASRLTQNPTLLSFLSATTLPSQYKTLKEIESDGGTRRGPFRNSNHKNVLQKSYLSEELNRFLPAVLDPRINKTELIEHKIYANKIDTRNPAEIVRFYSPIRQKKRDQKLPENSDRSLLGPVISQIDLKKSLTISTATAETIAPSPLSTAERSKSKGNGLDFEVQLETELSTVTLSVSIASKKGMKVGDLRALIVGMVRKCRHLRILWLDRSVLRIGQEDLRDDMDLVELDLEWGPLNLYCKDTLMTAKTPKELLGTPETAFETPLEQLAEFPTELEGNWAKSETVPPHLMPTNLPSDVRIEPSLDRLRQMSERELQKVQGLTLENPYGTVKFLEPVDLTGFDFTKDITIVRKNFRLYPLNGLLEQVSPEKGTRANRKCEVTLQNFRPRDGETDLEFHLKRLRKFCDKNGWKFADYNQKTGQLTFLYNH
jgi:hypothetical protein